MGVIRYVKGFFLEPFLGIAVVPAVIQFFFPDTSYSWLLPYPLNLSMFLIGFFLFLAGILLVLYTTYLFAKFGQGSAAPWDPPTKFVVHGVYRYVRNPMVLGVVLTVLGEVVLFGSLPLLYLFLALTIGNHILFVKSEEPELEERFGEAYKQYMDNVPRWLPRRNPWTHESTL